MCNKTDKRVALIGIIIRGDEKTASQVNDILSEYRDSVIGRMGLPYREKNFNIMSIIVDATNDTISSLSGKLGMIEGINVKTIYDKSN